MSENQATRHFYDLVWPHRAGVLRVAQILTNDWAEADDLAQETLLKAFRAIDQFRPGTSMHQWLMAILRNTRIDRLRSTSSSSRNVSLEDLGTEPADDSSLQSPEDASVWSNPQEVLDGIGDQQVIAALQQLPEEIRWTLLLVDVQGLDHSDVAIILGVPVGTIKSRAHRGRSMLREALLPLAKDLRLVPKGTGGST